MAALAAMSQLTPIVAFATSLYDPILVSVPACAGALTVYKSG
ncbi:hypothetical protein F4695_004003 [Rhizobium soli]|uniref:Uncharacterized protein n=1 Tax=Rhizobium soli TaxID=424798 RepID=A0A7X0JPM7_9HYPH|nr:hypothetical protein [Rhizobium soli]